MTTPHPSHPVRALVIEDEIIIADYLVALLNDAGILALVAPTVAEALQLFERHTFHLLFVDLGLPDRSGLEVIDTVQRSHPSLPIIISTGYGDSVLRDSIIEQRNVHLLTKPYAATELNGVLRSCGMQLKNSPMA